MPGTNGQRLKDNWKFLFQVGVIVAAAITTIVSVRGNVQENTKDIATNGADIKTIAKLQQDFVQETAVKITGIEKDLGHIRIEQARIYEGVDEIKKELRK